MFSAKYESRCDHTTSEVDLGVENTVTVLMHYCNQELGDGEFIQV